MFIISRRLESIMRSSRINFDRAALIIWDRDAPEQGGDDGGRRGRLQWRRKVARFATKRKRKKWTKLGETYFK